MVDDYLAQVIRERVLADNALLEEVCERSIQGGVCGVKVLRSSLGVISAEVDPDVPYGEIHEHYAPER